MKFKRFKQIWQEVFKDYVPPENPIMTDTCSPEVLAYLDKIADAKTPEEIIKINTETLKIKREIGFGIEPR
jgi:hypothetical protein